jgi:hypothetical protein
MTDTLDELEKLLKAGTPGPWERALNVVIAGSERVAFVWRDEDGQYSAANAALIVAAINAMPGLIESARRVEEMQAALTVMSEAADQFDDWDDDDKKLFVALRLKDLRRARAALAKDATT